MDKKQKICLTPYIIIYFIAFLLMGALTVALSEFAIEFYVIIQISSISSLLSFMYFVYKNNRSMTDIETLKIFLYILLILIILFIVITFLLYKIILSSWVLSVLFGGGIVFFALMWVVALFSVIKIAVFSLLALLIYNTIYNRHTDKTMAIKKIISLCLFVFFFDIMFHLLF